MLGFLRRPSRQGVIDRFHATVVEASRAPGLYGPSGFPDTVEGRFESLVLHVLLVLRRLRHLPAPAGDVAQELVDAVFAHLEIALRETGIGDMGVPKRMKKLGRAFYDRTVRYDVALEAVDRSSFAGELARRLGGGEPRAFERLADYCFRADEALRAHDLDSLLKGARFPASTLNPNP